MKPVNIYALTRISDPKKLELLEKQMSKRRRSLSVKKWETEGLKSLSAELLKVMPEASNLDFYYSFTMPKLGKEFDLLRVNDDIVINIELKSGNVTEEAIKKQLLKNRYYLAILGRNMYFYTYINSENRLLRLTHGMRLVEADFSELAALLEKQTDCYDGHIEELFKEDKYLISPLSDPGRFLRQEYFLTSQQNDIKRKILKIIRDRKGAIPIQGFTGLPGTGKTILLYDIAMQLSYNEPVCIFHFGSHEKELEELDKRLKRIDFYYIESTPDNVSFEDMVGAEGLKRDYSAILIDEGHRIDEDSLNNILAYAKKWKAPIIFSYDREDIFTPDERLKRGAILIEAIPGYSGFRLTNKIRMNTELSAFINLLMCISRGNKRHDYPSVSLTYANNKEEAEKILRKFISDGYIHIYDDECEDITLPAGIKASEATCKEFDDVVMMINPSFYYDDEGYLCYAYDNNNSNGEKVKNLFHGLSRAKKRIALLILDNDEMFSRLIEVF